MAIEVRPVVLSLHQVQLHVRSSFDIQPQAVHEFLRIVE